MFLGTLVSYGDRASSLCIVPDLIYISKSREERSHDVIFQRTLNQAVKYVV